jgi:Ca2+/Na+ antiporter
MDHAPATDRSPGPVAAFIGSFPGLLVCLAAAALGLYLLITHTGHMIGGLPYLLLLACPLMHLFMHRGHRHDARQDG